MSDKLDLPWRGNSESCWPTSINLQTQRRRSIVRDDLRFEVPETDWPHDGGRSDKTALFIPRASSWCLCASRIARSLPFEFRAPSRFPVWGLGKGNFARWKKERVGSVTSKYVLSPWNVCKKAKQSTFAQPNSLQNRPRIKTFCPALQKMCQFLHTSPYGGRDCTAALQQTKDP